MSLRWKTAAGSPTIRIYRSYELDGGTEYLNNPTVAQESRLARKDPIPGKTRQGPIEESVDLKTSFGFGITRDEHSAQYTRSIQQLRPYYARVRQIMEALP